MAYRMLTRCSEGPCSHSSGCLRRCGGWGQTGEGFGGGGVGQRLGKDYLGLTETQGQEPGGRCVGEILVPALGTGWPWASDLTFSVPHTGHVSYVTKGGLKNGT